jgi:hypothetical protein
MGSLPDRPVDRVVDITSESTGAIENRQHVRVAMQTAGFVRLAETDEWVQCTVVNISTGGIQLAFSTQASPFAHSYQPFIVRFRVGTEYSLEAAFVWGGEMDKQYRVGLEWTDNGQPQFNRLRVELMRLVVQRRRHRR